MTRQSDTEFKNIGLHATLKEDWFRLRTCKKIQK